MFIVKCAKVCTARAKLLRHCCTFSPSWSTVSVCVCVFVSSFCICLLWFESTGEREQERKRERGHKSTEVLLLFLQQSPPPLCTLCFLLHSRESVEYLDRTKGAHWLPVKWCSKFCPYLPACPVPFPFLPCLFAQSITQLVERLLLLMVVMVVVMISRFDSPLKSSTVQPRLIWALSDWIFFRRHVHLATTLSLPFSLPFSSSWCDQRPGSRSQMPLICDLLLFLN